MTGRAPGGDQLAELPADLPAEPGAYILVIDLATPLAPALPRRPETRLEPGRYAYCGSAWGPGGLKARLARHLRADKAPRWHVDRLTAAGRIVELLALVGARECRLRAVVESLEGAGLPVPGFGSSDCSACRAHLLSIPAGTSAAQIERMIEISNE